MKVKRLSAVVSDEEYRRVEKLVKAGAAPSIAQLIREAVDECANKLEAGKLLNLRTVPLELARKEVENYLKDHLGLVWPDEMAEELGVRLSNHALSSPRSIARGNSGRGKSSGG
jgi:hypothetical protein